MAGTKDLSQYVKVAVNIRPLVTPELLMGCTDCITVVPGEHQVQIGSYAFIFDYVFGGLGYPSNWIFDECVAPIVDSLFHGYNGTVLAYGQTGSGKTYTMGTNYNGEDHSGGVIPKVMEAIFSRVEASTAYLIRVSFIEIFNEEVFDLLGPSPLTLSRGDGASLAKPSGPARKPIQIRETINGGITLAGVEEAAVRTKEEMASFLLRGSVARATGSTDMNSQSSRSHAIFTITLEQRKIASCPPRSNHDDSDDDILIAKLHLVDLAGSERAKRTGAEGMRFREGIHINKGLFALGNVISALGDNKRRKGGLVPYRDSKLTRLLQDSLGGNSKIVMIACVSPADTNLEQTLSTLIYANRARNIQNKPIINRAPVAVQMQSMQSQIDELQSVRGDSGTSFEELKMLKHKISLLEASNRELQRELQNHKIACEHLTQCALDAQIEKDKLLMKIEPARNSKSWDEIDENSAEAEMKRFATADTLVLKKYFEKKVMELEHEERTLQKEIEELRNELSNISSNSDGSAQKLKEDYPQKLNTLESQVAQLKEQKTQAQLLRQKQKSGEAAERLQDEIHRIKRQKVQLQQKIKQESEQFRMWKASREKEILQALKQAIEHELEVASRVHWLAKTYKEVAQLKEEAQRLKRENLSGSSTTMSPGARSSRLFQLENKLKTLSSTIVSMELHLPEAEERERAFSGRGQWNQVQSLIDAKNLMEHLFILASTARCHLWDKDVFCREKDLEIRELKEKKLSSKKHAKDNSVESGTSGLSYDDGCPYQLRQKLCKTGGEVASATTVVGVKRGREVQLHISALNISQPSILESRSQTSLVAADDSDDLTVQAVDTLPSYPKMILASIHQLNKNNGSNKTSISKHIKSTYGELPPGHSTLLTHHLNNMIKSGQLTFFRNNYLIHDPNAPPPRGRGRPPKFDHAVRPARPMGRPPKAVCSANDSETCKL